MELVLNRPYVEERNGGLYIAGSRVSLDSIVYAYRGGYTPDQIVAAFPAVRLEQVYGAIAFYLDRREQIDRYLEDDERQFEAQRRKSREGDENFLKKIATARRDRNAR